MDVTGRMVPLGEVNRSEDHVYTINTESVTSGFYILKVNVGNSSHAMKVIKE
jgi:hypothetical protein